jgi:hypothetical protein
MLLEDSNPMGYHVHLVPCAYIAGKMHSVNCIICSCKTLNFGGTNHEWADRKVGRKALTGGRKV